MVDGDGTRKARFEPPPWEKEAFEALAARRAEEEAARAVVEAIETNPTAPFQEPGSTAEASAEPAILLIPGGVDGDLEDADLAPADLALVPASEPAAAPASSAPAPKPVIDERMVEAMLIQLKGEEQVVGGGAKRVGQVASVLTFALGLGMLIVGLVMMRSGGGTSVAVIGSAVLAVFGLCFIGMASWVWITTNRTRGR
jgi:hypothetical protein